jgi:hypothetical protein
MLRVSNSKIMVNILPYGPRGCTSPKPVVERVITVIYSASRKL